MDKTRKIKFFVIAAGILISFITFGILQERVNQGEYGEEKEKFTFFFTLVFIQCVCFAATSKGEIFPNHVQHCIFVKFRPYFSCTN